MYLLVPVPRRLQKPDRNAKQIKGLTGGHMEERNKLLARYSNIHNGIWPRSVSEHASSLIKVDGFDGEVSLDRFLDPNRL